MADENKDYVVKITADTQQFVSDVKDADKVVNEMKKNIASTKKLVQEMAEMFKTMSADAQSIGSELAKGIAEAQKELDKLVKTASKSASGSSGMQKAAKSSKDAAKAMGDAGKKAAKNVKDTGKAAADAGQKMDQAGKKMGKAASDAGKKMEEAQKTAASAGQKIKDDLKGAAKQSGMDKPFKVTATVDGKEIEGTIRDAEKVVQDAGDTKRGKTLPFTVDAQIDGKSMNATVKDVNQLEKDLDNMKSAAADVEDIGHKTRQAADEMVRGFIDIGQEASKASASMASDSMYGNGDSIRMTKEEAEAKAEKNKKIKEEIELERQRKAEKQKDKPLPDNEYHPKTKDFNAEKSAAQGVADAVKSTGEQMRTADGLGRRLSGMYTSIRSKLNPAWAESERRAAKYSARLNELIRQREKVANTRYHSDEWHYYDTEMRKARSSMNALEQLRMQLEYKMNSGLFGKEAVEQAKKSYDELGERFENLGKKYDEYSAKRDALNEGAGKAGTENPEHGAINAEIEAVQRLIDMTRASRSGVLSKMHKHTRHDAQKLTTILKNTYSKIKSFFSKVFHLSNNRSSERGLKRIADAFTRLWGMFRTRLKRRFISAVFEDAKSDMVQLAKAFPSMNDAISGVVNSAKQLGAQLLSILQPIITVMGPLVTKVLDAATVAADKIAQFSAKLFGQDMYGKATKGNYDFVQSMDETTKSVSDANNALTDYSSNLLGFDKLNQLQAVGDDGKASISAVNTDPVQENAFNKWAEELNELYKNKDWEGFGRKLADGLNTAVKWINSQDWDALSGKVTGFIANIQKGFNGFIDAFDAEGVGEAIAHIGNLIIDAWNQLVKPVEEGGFDTYKLGQKIGTILVTALKDIKWDQAGVAFGNTGNRLVELLRGILEQKFTDETGEHTLGYGIGKAISTFITNALKTINTDDWATIIADLFENLLDMFIQIFSAGPDLGAKIAEILNKSLKKIPAGKLGEAISGLSRTFNSLIENIHWGDVASKLGEALSHVDFWSVIKSIFFIRIGKKLGSLGNNLLGGLFGTGTNVGSGHTGLLSGLLGRLLGRGTGAGGGAGTGAGSEGLISKLGSYLSTHPLATKLVGASAAIAALWAGNQIGRALSQDKIEAYHEFKESGEVLDTSKWDTAQHVGGWLMATIDNITDFLNPFGGGVFDGFSDTYGEAMKAAEARKIEEENAAKFYENMANGYSEAKTKEARERNGDAIDELISSHILKDYQNNLSRAMLEERYGMTVYDMNRRYGLNLEYDGQTSALTETVQNNTTAMQSVEASTNASAEAMTKAADYIKSMFESLQKDTDEGQQVNLMIDGYKFGEFVLKQLGTLMHVKLAAT